MKKKTYGGTLQGTERHKCNQQPVLDPPPPPSPSKPPIPTLTSCPAHFAWVRTEQSRRGPEAAGEAPWLQATLLVRQ